MTQVYKCCKCNEFFVAPEGYEDDPKTRVSPCCNYNPVSYEGFRGSLPYLNSDKLGEGVKGIFNPADGKTYDSKSAYYNAVKAKGLVIDDSQTPRKPDPKLKPINWEKSVKQTIDQLSPTQKGKKK